LVLELINTADPLVRVGMALLILVFGHLGVKAFNLGVRKYWRSKGSQLTRKEVKERNEALKYVSYALDSGIIILALLYLNTGINTGLIDSLIEFVPQMISAILVVILGFLAINITTKAGSDFMKTLGVHMYFQEIGLSQSALKLFAGIFKGFLYLLLLQIALTELGIGSAFVDELVKASSWAAAFLVAGLVFYGFKDLFQNYAAGIYLKNSRVARPGEEIDLDGERAEIRNVSLFSTTMDTQSGRTVLSPNSRLMDSNISAKRTKSDLETLEDIKSYFVADQPGLSAPASLVMALDIMGYRVQQEEVAEKLSGTDPEQIQEAVKDLTEDEVKTGFVERDKITDIGSEFKTWFNDGALTLAEVNKEVLFSSSEGTQHLLCVGVEGSEILVVDPGSKQGGVYYINKEKLLESIKSSEKPGYTVIAPSGTTAFWRLKNNLVYSDKSYYDELSKTLESRLTRIMRRGRILKESMPSSVSQYIEKWEQEGDVTRLWSPEDED
jgi:small-conductance mechanosensitive channel